MDAGDDLPPATIAAARTPLVPGWIYFLFANFGMLMECLRHGILLRLGARPYAKVQPG